MKTLPAVLCLISGVLVSPAVRAAEQKRVDNDMQRAIAWERYKDLAAARQARKEARHPSVTYNHNANREADESTPRTRMVDPGSPDYRKK
jgi:hypothetical protein